MQTPAQACGTLVVPTAIGQGAPAAIGSLNPLLDASIGSLQAWLLLYRPLVWIGNDDRMDPARSLAASITPNAANTEFRVTLKPWRWSDGAPITADDAIFAIELARRLGPLYAFAGQGGVPDRIAALRADSPATLTITLNAATNPEWFILNGLSAIAPLPRHAWGNPDRDTLWRHQTDPTFFRVVGGPFRLASFAPGRYAVFTPNPLYGGRRSTLDRLVIDLLPGAEARREAAAGALDMAGVPAALAARPAPPGFHLVRLPPPFGYRRLLFNVRNGAVPFLADPRIRRALTMAADQQAMIRLVYHGHAAELRAPIPPASPDWTPPGFDPDAPHHDPAAAARLLDDAGYRLREGVRARNGTALAFTVLVSTEAAEAQAELQILQQNLAALGIALRIRPVTETELDARVYGGEDWEAAVVGLTRAGVPDGAGVFDTTGAENPGGVSDPETDRLVAAGTSAPGRDALYALFRRLQQQQPINLLPEGEETVLVSDRIRGLADFVSRQGFWSPEYLSLCAP